jgi:glutamate racemase
LACNTAAAYSVRTRQEEFPQKKVLSITIPGIEKILENHRNDKTIGVLATQATILSNIYTDIFLKLGGESPRFQGIIASELVDIIESGSKDEVYIQNIVNGYLAKFDNIDHLIL